MERWEIGWEGGREGGNRVKKRVAFASQVSLSKARHIMAAARTEMHAVLYKQTKQN